MTVYRCPNCGYRLEPAETRPGMSGSVNRDCTVPGCDRLAKYLSPAGEARCRDHAIADAAGWADPLHVEPDPTAPLVMSAYPGAPINPGGNLRESVVDKVRRWLRR